MAGFLDYWIRCQYKYEKPFLHIGQEQFLNGNIDGDINGSNDGKRNFDIYNTITDQQKSYGVYKKQLTLSLQI